MQASPDCNTGNVVGLLFSLRETINGGKNPRDEISRVQIPATQKRFYEEGIAELLLQRDLEPR